MAVIASIVVALAALLHGYIFLMESVWWTRPATWKRFGVADQAAADTTRPMAYNQGFYNLFLGIGAALGLVLYWSGAIDARQGPRAVHDRVHGARRARAHDDRAWLPAGGVDPGHAAAHRVRAVRAGLTA